MLTRPLLAKNSVRRAWVMSIGAAVAGCQASPPPTNPEDGCLIGSPPPATTALLLDATDALSPAHSAQWRAAVEEERKRLPVYGRLILLVMSSDSPFEPKVIVSLCRPPDGASVSSLTGNPTMTDAQWRRKFAWPIDHAVERLMRVPTASTSPILETVTSVTWRPDFTTALPHRRLRIVSDLLEYSPRGFSSYGDHASWDSYQRSPLARDLKPNFAAIEVRIDLLHRPSALRWQETARQFWTRWFNENGTSAVAYDAAGDATGRPQTTDSSADEK